jgi:hypothetical protein
MQLQRNGAFCAYVPRHYKTDTFGSQWRGLRRSRVSGGNRKVLETKGSGTSVRSRCRKPSEDLTDRKGPICPTVICVT